MKHLHVKGITSSAMIVGLQLQVMNSLPGKYSKGSAQLACPAGDVIQFDGLVFFQRQYLEGMLSTLCETDQPWLPGPRPILARFRSGNIGVAQRAHRFPTPVNGCSLA